MESVCIGLDKDQRPIKQISSKTLMNEITHVFQENENIHSVTLAKKMSATPMTTTPTTPINPLPKVWTIDNLICGC